MTFNKKGNVFPQKALELALQQHSNGNFQEAKKIYQNILKAEPNQPDALHFLGLILYQEGKSERAIDLLSKALSIKPNFAKVHSNLGNMLREMGRSDEAIKYLKKAINIEPNFADAHNNLGTAFHDLKNFDDASESYTRALSLKPDFVEAHNNLGNLMRDLGKARTAIFHYQKALSIKPHDAEVCNNLGNALRDCGKLDEAVSCYHRALTINPCYVQALNNLGASRLAQEDLEKALLNFEKIKEIKPDFPVNFHLGTTLQGLGRYEEAISSYELHDSKNARAKLLECLYALGRYEEFHLRIEKLSIADENNIRAAAISAFAANQLNRPNLYPFCQQPLEFVRIYQTFDDKIKSKRFVRSLVDLLKNWEFIWEPSGNTTIKGFQSPSNLFSESGQLLSNLERLIREKIDHYCAEFCASDCGFIKLMPKNFKLRAWGVRLLEGGHQKHHIHTDGWLSGVYYLQIPERICDEEGSIEFGLWGYAYPILNKNYPKFRYSPQNADIVLFPSSLFHRTIPFNSNEERICIAFDMIPL